MLARRILSEGIGGIGPGLSGGFNVITAKGFVIGAEYTTAWFEQEQSGRLVLGGFPLETIPRHDEAARLDAERSSPGTRHRARPASSFSAALAHGSIARRSTASSRDRYDNDDEGELLPLTGGVDVLRSLSSRAQFVIGGRYTYNQRRHQLQYLGIGLTSFAPAPACESG